MDLRRERKKQRERETDIEGEREARSVSVTRKTPTVVSLGNPQADVMVE